MATRREFLNRVAAGAAGWALAANARSYARIVGANDRLNFAVIGLNGRASALTASLMANRRDARISHVCDVDGKILRKFAEKTKQETGEPPAAERDFRQILALKEVDAVAIATPDHWHAPMAMAALEAGKHVYLEKPSSHNPAEGALLLEAQRKYKKLVQLGTQQRSSAHTIEIIEKINNGLVGKPYFAKAWYANVRKSIGTGKEIPVPADLDWDLWQGPAPRRPYKDNYHPYNWHWFRNWGTGEALNNGTHEVDVCRWALGVDYPRRVTASGGRYHFHDDWEFYDTLVASFAYEDKMICWEGRSCEGMKLYGRDRGTAIQGTAGTVVVDRDGYDIFNLDGEKTGEFRTGKNTSTKDVVGGDAMTDAHFANFIAGIKTGEKLRAPIEVGNVTVTMLQISNIAWELQRELHLNPRDGSIANDAEASKSWGRAYEPGWEPRV